jgi:hypothetical protein
MRNLAARDLLQVWEWGQGQHPVDRALTLLAVACPEMTPDELAALSIGQRDSLLLALRELVFGPRLNGYVECPRCSERLEFSLLVEDLRTADAAETKEAELTFTKDEFQVRYRLPDSLDLAAIVSYDDVAEARNLLIRRCISEAHRGETRIDMEALPDTVITALGTHLAQQDALAEVQLDLHCPACGHGWPMMLDILSFLWTEISALTKRLLREVHTLALAYGWPEADILSMSARRRQLYLEMVT